MEGFKGGGEVRRLHIVYFLSRNGRVEHPHLIRVHHLHRNGVRLRDVKRWLSELRGKEMPESFAWSYKRRYKTGYVWQDLVDDDLITPISDNEYVLKGSELSNDPTFQSFEELSCGDGKKPKAVEEEEEEEGKKVAPEKSVADTFQIEPDDDGVSPKPPPCLDQDSPLGQPQGSDALNESIPGTVLFKLDLSGEFQKEKREEGQDSPPGMAGHGIDHINNKNRSSDRNNRSRKASHVIRNILTCGQVETNDSALRTIKRRNSGDGSQSYHQVAKSNNSSRRGPSTSGAKTRPGEKAVRAAHKPVGTPNCSQCGKAFKPEKLHSHMKSCKALRVRGRGMNSERMPLRTEPQREDLSTESAPGFLLTH